MNDVCFTYVFIIQLIFTAIYDSETIQACVSKSNPSGSRASSPGPPGPGARSVNDVNGRSIGCNWRFFWFLKADNGRQHHLAHLSTGQQWRQLWRQDLSWVKAPGAGVGVGGIFLEMARNSRYFNLTHPTQQYPTHIEWIYGRYITLRWVLNLLQKQKIGDISDTSPDGFFNRPNMTNQ